MLDRRMEGDGIEERMEDMLFILGVSSLLFGEPELEKTILFAESPR